jgi:xanthine dehydrogenase accessory factor
MMERMTHIYSRVDRWLEREEPFALGTIIQAEGSTPQTAGASALFSAQGLLFGTLGGGTVEADAQRKAVRCLREGKSQYYKFEFHGDLLSREEAVCGGSVSILIDASPLDHLEAFRLLKKSLLSRQEGVLISRVRILPAGDVSVTRRWFGEKPASEGPPEKEFASMIRDLEKVRQKRKPKLLGEEGKGDGEILFFLEPLFPLPRLVIAGAGHIGQAVAHLGSRLGFEVTVIDDRADFANAERFPDADALVVGDIGKMVADFPIASDTYIVIVTRGHSQDAEALRSCIQSSASYVGMIGSKRKIALMRETFLVPGWATAQQFDRIRAPIGLEIGSQTVEEIAVSIAAELVLVRNRAGSKMPAGQE